MTSFILDELLITIATEIEQSVERLLRDKIHLNNTGRYYHFNVNIGLKDIELEELKKKKEVAAATRRYIGSKNVRKRIQECADNMAGNGSKF